MPSPPPTPALDDARDDVTSLHTLHDVPSRPSLRPALGEKEDSFGLAEDGKTPTDSHPGENVILAEKVLVPTLEGEVVLGDVELLAAAAGTGAEDEGYPEGGRGWWVVAGCAMIAAVTIGFPLVWGVFQEYYLTVLFPGTSPSVLGFLGSIPPGFMFPVSVVCGKLGDRYGYKRFVISGCIICFLCMILSAFCTQLWQFFITQGILPAIGYGLIMPFVMSYPSQWFKRLRAMATGLVIAGGSLGGGVATLIVRALLTRLGLRNTLLIYAFIHLAVLTLGCFLIKSRPIPGAPPIEVLRQRKIVWIDRALLSQPVFWSAGLAMMFTCCGYPSPLYFLAEYAQHLDPTLSPTSLAVPVALNNFMSAIGRTLVGRLADRIGVINAFVLAVTISALSQLLLWNFAKSYGVIMAFSVVFGFWGGCFVSLAAPMAASLFGVYNLATLSGMLLLFNTPGNVSGAPLFGAILNATGQNWQAAISFSGAVQLVGVGSILYARFKTQPKLFAVV